MEKKKRWQLTLILATIFLTIFNILPTVFFYTKPLKASVDEKRAKQVACNAANRINALEKQSVEWIESFCKLLNTKPISVTLNTQNPDEILVNFSSSSDAQIFSAFLPRAGSLVPFAPASLTVASPKEMGSKNVVVKRQIPIHFDESNLNQYFQFSSKVDADGKISPLYKALVSDRLTNIILSLGGSGENARAVQSLLGASDELLETELAMQIAQNLDSFVKAFGENSSTSKRFFSSFTQISQQKREDTYQQLISKLEAASLALHTQKKDSKEKNEIQSSDVVASKEKMVQSALALLRKHPTSFTTGPEAWNYQSAATYLSKCLGETPTNTTIQTISLEGKNPFIEKLQINWGEEKVTLSLYGDTQKMLSNASTPGELERADAVIYNMIAFASREGAEEIKPSEGLFAIQLSKIPESKTFLAFRLSAIAKARMQSAKTLLTSSWQPQLQELQSENFPAWDYETFSSLNAEQKKLGLLFYSPVLYPKNPETGFRMNSVYVVGKGLGRILQKYEENPSSEEAKQFLEDFHTLRNLLGKMGFTSYRAAGVSFGKEYKDDFIFEAPDYFQSILMASRENFSVHGTKRYAVLEFSNVEQRILTENKIDTSIHEDLLKWRDDYHAAQVKKGGMSRYDVPKPTASPLLSNLKLSFTKYFRGDDRKILHWGLDLSGGKTVQIQLRDSNNKVVTTEAEIRQGINELYDRVNKMGVSEVSIRQEGDHITLDFPGAQGLSAAELVKASSMYFHVINEKFSSSSSSLHEIVSRFLQEVWNQAVVTNKTSADEINYIAYKHLYGDMPGSGQPEPRSEAAKILYQNGLRLALPSETMTSSAFSEATSKVAIIRGDDFTDWYGQTHPLLIVFNNFALEGSSLTDVHASYDPSKGNFLSFSVRSDFTSKKGIKTSPRDDFSAWTTPFSKEKIAQSASDSYTKGRGWRMAVVLNGTVISAPTLDSPLRDNAMISGNFSQREINQLEADLKAGSLSYTPKILSEQNVSPELGTKERMQGIVATVLALALVIAVMITYYRFGGLVAAIAVVFNLLIMWATLQNIEATLTLPMIAGLILTVGMAVDANVLVFERIREEFAISGRIASAIEAGYEKAFSAILDSNVTTVIAGLVLLHFDSGPIKGFALTLIIGIASSMFTALFMTRYFFARWIERSSHKKLTMMSLFKNRSINFLKYTKTAAFSSFAIIAIGAILFIAQRHTLIGMDFTGGYALTVEVEPEDGIDYRDQIEKAFASGGISSNDMQIRELSPSNHVRIFLARSLELAGKPFFNMPISKASAIEQYTGENPRVEWIVKTLSAKGLKLTRHSSETIDTSWSEISGQMSETMRSNAIYGLMIALVGILIYITIRFEFKYAISATICLAHDIIFTLAALAILQLFGVPLQIDLNIIAALMTIVGYSLNDTIIIFDRIREDMRLMKGSSPLEIINHSLNVTLSRTIMTSGTTLLVLIPLIFLGGTTVLGFSLVMAIGVIFGTLSSLFIAAPLMLYFQNREKQKAKASFS